MTNEFYVVITKATNQKHIDEFNNDNKLNGVLFYGRGSLSKSFWDFLGLRDNSKILYAFRGNVQESNLNQLDSKCKDLFISKVGGNMSKEKLFVCIINSGFADEVMDIARNNGATGGTILDGRGTGRVSDMLMGSTVDSAKEVVLIFCNEQTAKLLEEKIEEHISTKASVSGICFTLNAKLFKELNVDNK
ncbi:MAG: hypothetical protein IJ318_00940 [Clostridia bacterium]|nr:hypothetical protein [Clostridia bacterium]